MEEREREREKERERERVRERDVVALFFFDCVACVLSIMFLFAVPSHVVSML